QVPDRRHLPAAGFHRRHRPASGTIRADGSVLALVRANGAASRSVAAVNSGSGQVTPVGDLPLSSGNPAAVRWDAAHAQALIAQQQNGTVTYALATFGSEVVG